MTTNMFASPMHLERLSFAAVMLVLTCALFPLGAIGQGSVLVTPTRVEFKGNKRFDVMSVMNTGADTGTYRLTFHHYMMRKDGHLELTAAPDSGTRFADSLLRFFPKQVTLGPGQSQTIRIQVSKPPGLEPGEYRTHVGFTNIRSGTAHSALAADTGRGLHVTMRSVLCASIPVVVWHHVTEPSVGIAGASIERKNGRAELTFNIMRQGAASSYGDVEVRARSAEGKTSSLKVLRGVGVYYPNPLRIVTIRFDSIPSYASDLQIEYRRNTGADVLATGYVGLSGAGHTQVR
jgi:hypothetical protein